MFKRPENLNRGAHGDSSLILCFKTLEREALSPMQRIGGWVCHADITERMIKDKEIIEIIIKALDCSEDTASHHVRKIEGTKLYFAYKPVRGGNSVIFNKEGDRLVVGPKTSFELHLKFFEEGFRN